MTMRARDEAQEDNALGEPWTSRPSLLTNLIRSGKDAADVAEQALLRHYRNAVGQSAASLEDDISAFQHPTQESPFLKDMELTKRLPAHKQRRPRIKLLTLNMGQSYHKIENVRDHLRAMKAMYAVDPPLTFAPSSATRVIVEAVAGVGALLDPGVGTEERILRASGDLLESYQQNVNATRQLPVSTFPDAAIEAERRLDGLVVLIERAGCEVVRQSNGKPKQIRLMGGSRYRGVPTERISSRVEATFSAYPALYQMGSGIAHSMEWMLGDHARIPIAGESRLIYKSDPYVNGAAATTAIAAIEFLVTQYGRYMGHDPEDKVVPHRRRREAVDRYMNEYAAAKMQATGRL
ncbi:hypothetical protein [Actinoplanes sp. NPDC049599]|uniref:hypothetical protein n=1 Tax=Actinoplanes sp. NPDC049599 TaxID=3363903 RepID=UPI0037ACA7F3